MRCYVKPNGGFPLEITLTTSFSIKITTATIRCSHGPHELLPFAKESGVQESGINRNVPDVYWTQPETAENDGL